MVAALIIEKWKRISKFFYVQSALFFMFLIFYSSHVVILFNRPESYNSDLEKELSQVVFPSSSINFKQSRTVFNDDVVKSIAAAGSDEQMILNILKQNKDSIIDLSNFQLNDEHDDDHDDVDEMIASFLSSYSESPGIWICELLLLWSVIILLSSEVYQAIKLRSQYFKELENYIELAVLFSAIVSMIFKPIIKSNTWSGAFTRGISGLGICLAWLELIFLIGRYPFRGGDFSIMFYNIIKKLSRYMLAMIFMITGHAFAFMVINFGPNKQSFESPWKSLMMTLTMALGEFQFEDLYNSFKEDTTSRLFAMLTLSLLILTGTITMVNLFIAVIISDVKTLKNDVFNQNLVNMAQCSILVENLLPDYFLRNMKVDHIINVCTHNLCNHKNCKALKLENTTIRKLLFDFLKIK